MKLSEADIDRAIADNFGPSRFRAVEAERQPFRRADVIPLRPMRADEAPANAIQAAERVRRTYTARPFIPQGCDQQSRLQPTIPIKPEHLTSECDSAPEPMGRHVPPNTMARWAAVIVGAAVAIPAFLALVWLGQRVAEHFPH